MLLVHLPKGLIGAETAQLLGCLVLTAIWQAMAERAALPPKQRHPFAVYVDEVQDFASSPVPWDELFAQGRKYGLSLTVAHQNLGQLPKELRETILANARSKAVFALSGSDATVMERLFAPALTAADLQALDPYAVAALVALDSGSTARAVTLTTPPPLEAKGSAEAVRAASRQHYARPKAAIESALRQAATKQARAPVGRQRRRASR